MKNITQYNKAGVAGFGSLVTALLMWADTQYNLNMGQVLIAAIGTAATGFLTWLIPNIQKAVDNIGN